EVEEFYVKYKNFSYLHCEWRTASELEVGDIRVWQKIKRFKIKQQSSFFEQLEDDDYFNPDYVEVDRILDSSTIVNPDTNQPITHYLIKWRGLGYDESTWESEKDVDKQKVSYYSITSSLQNLLMQMKPRPSAEQWKSHEECPQYKNNNVLREYQLEGLNWLTFSYFNKQSCILADEMGLGKTIQSLTFIEEVYRHGIYGPFLIIVPLSTIANWQREFEAWTDLNVIVYHGSNSSRSMLQQYEMYYKDHKGKRINNFYKFNVLITTFECIITDLDILRQINWRVAVIDEAHRLKNRNCKLLQGLSSVDVEHRLLLTGTPLQNNVEELFSLLSFLEPKQFGSSETFMLEFGKLESDTQVEKLKSILKPVMLRRLKEDVEKSLAPKEETIIEVELTNIQKKYYRAILERNFAFLARGGAYASVPTLMNTMMELRKCCNHPFLINGAEDAILEEFNVSHVPVDAERLFQTMVQASGKLVLTDKLLPKLKTDGHKVLIFSQMIRVLDVIEDYLIHKKYLYERIDGRIRGSLRQEAIDRFCKPDSDRFVFLLCTRAGGLGINLTAADTVIIYDSDWNPQNDLQAQARCHRIGQQKSVKVYRLITRNTYEREMFDRASLKLGLDKAVLQSMGSKDFNSSNQLSKKEIEDLLKKGAYGALMDDDNSTSNDFCEEDIDHILQRRTQVVQVQAGVKGSTFAKASFSLSTNRMDIDVDDPHFWQKWAKKADLNVDQLMSAHENKETSGLIIEMPRQRRQVARYGKQDEPIRMSDLESSGGSDDDEDGKGRSGGNEEGADDDDGHSKPRYSRNECYNVEKCILIFGWGRWSTILEHGRFKKKLAEDDIRNITRAILLYSLKHYDGDDKIKMFIYDLISPSQDGMESNCRNHSGLSAPVPRGRKGRRGQINKKIIESPSRKFDGDLKKIDLDLDRFISDPSYKKHLKRHANKVLLRVRLLFYLQHTIIGNQAEKILQDANYKDVDIVVPRIDTDLPFDWWDLDADKCMLIGVFKHGYERYNEMRNDPALCFLSKCGPAPNDATNSSQMDIDENDDDEEMRLLLDDDDDDDEEDRKQTRRISNKKKQKQLSSLKTNSYSSSADIKTNELSGKLPFPTSSDLNHRLRRIITTYQKLYKKELMRQEQREKVSNLISERELARKAAMQNRWSRREETEFYRLVSSFGVERDPITSEFKWNRFRSLGHLDKKFDETLTEYYKAFIRMCCRVCKKTIRLFCSAANFTSDLAVETITEERASRCLARIELICRIRERVLIHPQFESRLSLCQPSPDLPDWWICGKHDKDLLLGVAKHGLSHMEISILCDPELSF
ncbi:hypothetical protein HELRODRAFT_149039, partial [Helobdella robusta]|uniref:DNA helicase n=1 Tax=Helobdella robusta TaxID=6412 RepID=T1EKC3_HELRO